MEQAGRPPASPFRRQEHQGEDAAGQVRPTQFRFEILAPATLSPVPDGEEGLVAVTHLNRRGTVLLRYLLGDISALSYGECPHCGLPGPRFVLTPFRSAGLTKVKGVLINPAELEAALSGVPGLDDFQVAVVKADRADPYSLDAMVVRALCHDQVQGEVRDRVERTVTSVAEIRPQVEFVDEQYFADQLQGYKFKRFVDERANPAAL